MNGARRFKPVDVGFCIILAVAGLLFFVHFRCPLQEPQEPRYAEIPRQMLSAGHFIVPIYHGQPYYDKPPLLYWLVMGSYHLFGVHDWAARVVACTAGFLCVLVTYWWARRTIGGRAALIGALVLCLSGRFVQLARLLAMDGLLCLWVVAAWATAHVALTTGRTRWRWWLASAAACSLAILTKGFVALVLVAGPVFLYQILDQCAARLGWRSWMCYFGLVAGLAGPWFVAMMVHDPGFANYFFWEHHVRRFVAPFDHAEPIWFYLPDVLLGMLPWTLLLPGLILCMGRRGPVRRPTGLGFFVLAALGSFLFFSLSGCKRSAYILPAMPPLALALGCYLDALLFREAAAPCRWREAVRHPRALAGVSVASILVFGTLMAAVTEVLPSYARRYSLRGVVRRHAEDVRDEGLPVVCYPRRWDSVSFYLQSNAVQVFPAEEVAGLIAAVQSHPSTLIFVKSEKWLAELQRCLPPSLEFAPHGRQGYVRVGQVRRRSVDQSEERLKSSTAGVKSN
jgi:4-amino-4-deoxy-L-arabinose transferase-like glycosyltransferase